jgi:bifunctional non-homologous end joining protein LigD
VKVGAEVALYSRNGRDLTGRFASVVPSIQKLPCRSVTLDGELVLMGPAGVDFYGLMERKGRTLPVALVVFDIMERGGQDLRPFPLTARKGHLSKLLSRNKSPDLAMMPSFDNGEELMLAVMQHSMEGVVSKRKNAPYASGSKPEWVKVKSPTWRQANKDRGELFRRI